YPFRCTSQASSQARTRSGSVRERSCLSTRCSASPRSGPVNSERKRETATLASTSSPVSQKGELCMGGGAFNERLARRFLGEIDGGPPFHRSLPAPQLQGGEEVVEGQRVRHGHGFPGGVA